MAQAPTVMSLQAYRDQAKGKTEQELADEFEVAQSTMHRWLKRDDVFVETRGRNGWDTVFVEKVLKQRKGRRTKK